LPLGHARLEVETPRYTVGEPYGLLYA
jgi:hypothetical protein